MRLALLTTDTSHHLYFARKVAEHFPWATLFLETRSPRWAFETSHPFERRRDEYEQEVLLAGSDVTYSDLAPTRVFESFNDPAACEALRSFAPEVVVVFGSGKLHPPIISVPTVAMLNLHGGNPEHYRGLDTHLWAIYHGDFENLVTTLHHVDSELDTGALVAQGQLPVTPGMELHQLRAANTQVCVDLSLTALGALSHYGQVPSRRQVSRGRYYSAMPAVLKDVCIRKFGAYTATL